MNTLFPRALAALLLLAPLGLVQAQEAQLASHAELNDVYARLAQLESQIAASNVSGSGCADAVGPCSDCGDDCCGCPGYEGLAEILWLKAFNSGNAFGDFNYDAGVRLWAGYHGASGLGARIRYFDFQNRSATNDLVDISAVDFEIYDRVQIGCNWDLYYGAGLRYLDYLVGTTGDGFIGSDITGVGPVATAELYRHLGDRSALYIIGRQSIIVGDGHLGLGGVTDLTNYTTELQLGLQLHRDWNGGLLFGRAGWEAQWYHEPDGGDEAITLMGGALSVGFMR